MYAIDTETDRQTEPRQTDRQGSVLNVRRYEMGMINLNTK